MDLKITTGTVNFTDYLHVTAAKVSDPSSIVWEIWIGAPVPINYNFVIPGLDPENYYISFYDAPTSISLGQLRAQLIANGLTGEFEYERRFYTTNGPGTYDPIDGATSITDPYFIGKNVTALFKEGFRFLKPVDEFTVDPMTGTVAVINGTSFSDQEKISIDLKYEVANSTSSSLLGLYKGTLNITAATQTLIADDVNKRIRLVGTASKQAVTLPALATIQNDNGFYFDNACGGTAMQVKILLPGAERIKYNGFMVASDLFAEFWVSKGEHLLIRKYYDSVAVTNYWEVITDYKGVCVGEKVTLGYKSHPGIITESSQKIDGDEYGRLWWWVQNVLPSTHKYITDAVATDPFVADPTRVGQFAVHSTLKIMRMPETRNTSERGLADFEFYGADVANRPIDYPGGFQNEMVGPHAHPFSHGRNGGIDSNPLGGGVAKLTQNNVVEGSWVLADPAAKEQRLKNTGVIYGRRI